MSYQPHAANWRLYAKTYANLSAASLTNDIELFSLPAKGVIHGVQMVPTVAFSGGLIATYTLSVGISGNLVKYCTAINGFTGFSFSQPQFLGGAESMSIATSIRLAAISTVGLLNAATAGAVDVQVWWSLMG